MINSTIVKVVKQSHFNILYRVITVANIIEEYCKQINDENVNKYIKIYF